MTKENRYECIIYRFVDDIKIYDVLNNYQINGIAWAHNYIMAHGAKRAGKCEYLKCIVMVSRQQYDRYIDDDIIDKCTYAYNIVESSSIEESKSSETLPVVTYTGALVNVKGFHILAKCWKKILKKVPDAQLYVIGTGNLYNENINLGKYKIAEEGYEKLFIPYLLDKNGNIDKSVHFMGKMGQEKREIYIKSRVGIINPSARTETFGLGAVELQSYGVPVVLKNKNGFPDIVKNNKTDYLFRNIKM